MKSNLRTILSTSLKDWRDNLYLLAIVIFIVYLPIQVLIEIAENKLSYILTQNEVDNYRFLHNINEMIRYFLSPIATLGIINFIIIKYSSKNIEITPISIISKGLKLWPKYISSSFAAAFRCILYFLLLIVPGIYKSIKLTFIDCIVADKDESGFDACDTSEDLVKGNWWEVFGYIIVFFILEVIIEISIVLLFNKFFDNNIYSVLIGIFIRFITSFLVIAKANYYLYLSDYKSKYSITL